MKYMMTVVAFKAQRRISAEVRAGSRGQPSGGFLHSLGREGSLGPRVQGGATQPVLSPCPHLRPPSHLPSSGKKGESRVMLTGG